MPHVVDEPAPSDPSTRGRHHPELTQLPTTATDVVVASTSLLFAVLVGVDGPAPWPVVRAVVVLVAGAGCLVARRRLGIRGKMVPTLSFGLAGMIAGLGIGVSHLVEKPWSAEAIAGSLTLVGGVVLASVSSWGLIRAAHRWWKLSAVPIGLAILVLVFAPVTLAVFVTNAPPFDPVTVTPADRGLRSSDVSMLTADHVRLEGRYIPSTNGAAIIVLGGISGIGEHEVDIAAVLARHGYGVLLLNARGQGDSDGDAMLWGWWGEIDVAAGLDYLAARADVVDGRIAAIGMSVGGEQAIAAAGVDRRLRAVVSEGATARGARDEGDPARGVGGLVVRYVDWVSRNAAALMTAADPPTPLRDSLAAFDGQRALLIAAGRSESEIAATDVFRASAPDRVDVWIAPDASHTDASRRYPDEWERRVVGFLDDTLAPLG
ncbi:MAG: alpha/beta hydrolase [Ilumatobacteraceae bacterium]